LTDYINVEITVTLLQKCCRGSLQKVMSQICS